MDTRAQSIGIARFVLSLVVGAVMFWIVSLVTDPLTSRAMDTTSNQSANTATGWFQTGVQNLPLIFALISFMGLIVYSVFVREVGR
jgi:hypothetical protein